MVRKLIKSGMNVARINFSHGTYKSHAQAIETIRRVSAELGETVAILQDLSGPKIRTGDILEGIVELKNGQEFTLTSRQVIGDANIVPVNSDKLSQEVKRGDAILVDDGMIELRVLEVRGEDVLCRVVDGGELMSRKGINLPGVSLSTSAITDKDIDDLDFGIEKGVDWIAASFVRNAADMERLKELIQARATDIPVIAKIEKHEAIDNIDEIIEAVDGIMVARGDLGLEIPTEDVPLVQKMIIEKCNRVGKPVITATQMLESMLHNPRPTRAEASDVANAIFDGTDAVMLSGETAIGDYPVEAVRTMAKIAEKTEEVLAYENILTLKKLSHPFTTQDGISRATCQIAYDLEAKLIITFTFSGSTARMVSKYRPFAPIIAVTPQEKVRHRLALVWGVYPLQSAHISNTDEMFSEAVQQVKKAGLAKDGDLVIITAGIPVGIPGTTNLIKVVII